MRPERWERRRRESALWRDPVLAVLVLMTFVSGLWFLAGTAGVTRKLQSLWVLEFASDAACLVLSLRVVRLPGASLAVRRFWGALSLVAGLFAIGDLSQLLAVFRAPAADVGLANARPVVNAFAGVGAVIMIAVMLTQPGTEPGRERLRRWLDTATIVVGAATFVWCCSLGGMLLRPGPFARLLVASGLLLVALVALMRSAARDAPPFTVRAGGIGALGASLLCVTGAVPVSHSDHLGLKLSALLLPAIMLQAAPRIQELQMLAAPEDVERAPRAEGPSLRAGRGQRAATGSGRVGFGRVGSGRLWSGQPFTYLPYLALAMTHGLLAVILLTDHGPLGPRLLGVLLGAVVSTGLVVARQAVAFADNAQLLARLDQSMLELSGRERRFRSLLQHASDVTLIVRDGVVTYASPAIEHMLGVHPDRFVGSRPEAIVHPEDVEGLRVLRDPSVLAPGVTIARQLRARHADGGWRWFEMQFTDLTDEPSVGGLVCNGRDITEAKRLHDRLSFQAWHDPLTGLANRALLDERLNRLSRRANGSGPGPDPVPVSVPGPGPGRRLGAGGATASVARGPDGHAPEPVRTAVLLIDLDDFKEVNDTYGHHVGDDLLVAVAGRLNGCVRSDDTIARLGGDEFVVLVPGVSEAEVTRLIARVRAAFDEPLRIAGKDLPIKASIGVATGEPDHPERLLRAADRAMYRAKRDPGDHLARVSVAP